MTYIGKGCPDIGDMATYDHKIPKHRGGTNELSNGTLACADCNNNKGSKSYEWFIKHAVSMKKHRRQMRAGQLETTTRDRRREARKAAGKTLSDTKLNAIRGHLFFKKRSEIPALALYKEVKIG
jgi:hypothetical protein